MDEYNTPEELQGIDSGCLLLKNLIDRFEYSYKLLSNEKEESFFEKPFFCPEDFLYFKENFEELIGVEEFNDFQIKYCNKLIVLLKKYLYDDVYSHEIEIDEEGFCYISIYINMQNKDCLLLQLYPFSRIIYIPENEYRKQILDKINEYESTIDELKELEKLLMISKKNPIMASESPVEMFKISFNPKKYKNKFNNSLKENDNNINECYRQIAEYRAELDEIESFDLNLDLNREDFVLDLKKSPFEFYLGEDKLNETFVKTNAIKDNNENTKTVNPLDEIEFFE